MKKIRFGFAIGVFLIAMVAGCAAPATPAPVPTAVPPTAQVIAAGFTPASACSVPNIVGLDQSAAQGMLVKLGLQPVLSNQYDAAIAEGAVISQKPAAGTHMEPCTGLIDIVVSLGPVPTLTPRPATATPRATATPEATATPTASATPDDRLYFDDFEDGIKPELGIKGANFTAINGRLKSEGVLEAAIGDSSWRNYAVSFLQMPEMRGMAAQFKFRVQDKDNYMLVRVRMDNGVGWTVLRVVGGEEQAVPGADGA